LPAASANVAVDAATPVPVADAVIGVAPDGNPAVPGNAPTAPQLIGGVPSPWLIKIIAVPAEVIAAMLVHDVTVMKMQPFGKIGMPDVVATTPDVPNTMNAVFGPVFCSNTR